MKLIERLQPIINKSFQHKYPHGLAMRDDLVEAFKQWALDLIGPDQDWTDYQPESSKIEARGANRLKGQLRQRIEESD